MAESHDLTLGILFIANVITASLWGVSSLQTYSYFTSYQDDRKWLKGLVFVAWSLDTLHQALIFHANYFYLVTNWGASPPTTRIIWSFQAQIPLNIVLSFTVQSFFVFRIWKLSKQNIVITTPVAVLVIAQLVGYMAFTCKVYANRFSDFSQFALLQDLVVAANIITVTADMSLAFTLTYLLHKSRTGFKSSDGMIKKLIVFTINTGLFASLNVLGALVAFVTSPSTAVYVLFYFIMARLYFNSLMANLNARKIVNGHSLYIESISIGSMRTPNRTSCRRRLLFAREEQPVHGMSVKIDTALEMRGDFNPIESDHRKGVLPIKSQTQ